MKIFCTNLHQSSYMQASEGRTSAERKSSSASPLQPAIPKSDVSLFHQVKSRHLSCKLNVENLLLYLTTDDEFSALKCRYASKRCWNLRAIKRNGERHNLCEMHRQKANSNQRRLDKKRKAGQAALGLPTHLPLHAGADLERRMRMRASIAFKLEQELGVLPLTTQYIRPPPRAAASLIELQRAAGLMAIGNTHNSHLTYSSKMESWRESSQLSPAAWMDASYPKSPRAMLRVAAMAKMVPASESRGFSPLTPPKVEPIDVAPSILLPPIATAMARSGEGFRSTVTLQRSWQPDVRRAPTLVTRANI